MKPPKRLEKIAFILQEFIEMLTFHSAGEFEINPAEENWESAAIFLFAQEQSCRSEVDALCRDIAHRRLPEHSLSSKEIYFLRLRMLCALDFLGILFPASGKNCPFLYVQKKSTDADLISWLLIDVWSQRYDHWMKLNMIAKYGSLGFYGIVERDIDER